MPRDHSLVKVFEIFPNVNAVEVKYQEYVDGPWVTEYAVENKHGDGPAYLTFEQWEMVPEKVKAAFKI